MSSDSSVKFKDHYLHKEGSEPNAKGYNDTSSESDVRQSSRASRDSNRKVKCTTQPKITILEQLSYKASPIELYKDEIHRETATSHNSTAPTVITAVLRDLCDDIVRAPTFEQLGPEILNGENTVAVIGGDNIYVQNKTKFIKVPREKALSTHQNEPFWAHHTSRLDNHTPLDVAVLFQKIFTPISSICFGLLGGVALLQIILVQHLIGGEADQDYSQFLQLYSQFAELTPLLFYVLLAACIVSVLDRVPVDQEAIVCQPSWFVVAVYAVTLLLTLSCASYDSMLSLFSQNKTMFQDQMRVQEVVSEWQFLNTLRCLFALFGCILFSLTSPPDCLLQYLLQIKQYEHNKSPLEGQ